jgi:hypothetical protein
MKIPISIFHWLPRIICILAILFISMFAGDAFEHGNTIWQKLGAFIMHLIPSFILLGILIFAWFREFWGGIIFIIVGLVLTPFVFNMNYDMNESIGMSIGIILSITFPFILVGILFLISHKLKKS